MGVTIAAMPAYNEEHSIAKLILGCRRYVDKVVVVDDGSTDATAEIADALNAYTVRHEVNMGYGAAIKSCFDAARKFGADRMVIIDSDGQHDPSDIQKLLEPLNNGADVVIGSRFCNGNGQNIPAYRRLGMKILDVGTNAVGGVNVSDSQSGFRAYGQRAIEKIKINENGMSAGSDILLQVRDKGLKIEEVPIKCRYDVERASTHNPLSHGISVLVKLLRDMEVRRPLYYFTLPGVLFASIGLWAGLDLIKAFFYGGDLSLWPILLSILIAIIGSFMIFTGIILHSISNLINKSLRDLDASGRVTYEDHSPSWNLTKDAKDN